MYRERIRDYYEHLSRSYRRVADFIMSNYYEVAFMTAAELAAAAGVDTTTIVRFAQRLDYKGYPALLQEIRDQVKAEIYAAYEPQPLLAYSTAALFRRRIEQEQHNLSQMVVHSPPEQIARVAEMLAAASSILFIGEGFAETMVQMAAQQIQQRGVTAKAANNDPIRLAGALTNLTSDTLVIGVSAAAYGDDVARAMEFARSRGCPLLGVVGALDSPVNRAADLVIFAPSHSGDAWPSLVALSSALATLVTIACGDDMESAERQRHAFHEVYEFLMRPETTAPDDGAQ
jgi:DNA-binding MurR/RpiR family transcriptional regulator